MDTDAAGSFLIQADYEDAFGERRKASAESVAAVRSVLEAAAVGGDSVAMVVEAGESHPVAGAAAIHLESAATRRLVSGEVPGDLPLGYHRLELDDGSFRRLIVAPARCRLPETAPDWGWSVQLYALLSEQSWGIGDFEDLRRFGEWASSHGAAHVLVNPLHGPQPGHPQEPSPYFPSSRCELNPLFISVPALGSRRGVPTSLKPAGGAAGTIDRDAIYDAKMTALRKIYPADSSEADFHSWLQMVADEQLEAAASGVSLITDVAVGVDPEGRDAARWPGAFARGVTAGAPPDPFNTEGQDWGVLPWHPRGLARLGYEPFIQTIRSAMRHAAGIRIDHVMGLFRVFWIPDGLTPSDGVYVRYPAQDLLRIVALESVRNDCFVVGEDLGTVEATVRRSMEERAILGCRLLWFDDPHDFPNWSVASVTTHDLPTIAGVWTGRAEGSDRLRQRLISVTGVDARASVADVIAAAYRLVGGSRAVIVLGALDDAVGAMQQPNQPGTTSDGRPNWSIPLPLTLEQILRSPAVADVAASLARAR